jgi:hypothetical protein
MINRNFSPVHTCQSSRDNFYSKLPTLFEYHGYAKLDPPHPLGYVLHISFLNFLHFSLMGQPESITHSLRH